MAKRIPREFIHQLLSHIDIVELIDGRVPLKKKSGNNYFACCPFHDEKSASFSVSHAKQFFHCFGCGVHGNAIDFLMQYDRLTFPEAIESLAKLTGLTIPQEESFNKAPAVSPDLYALLEKVNTFYRDALKQSEKAIDYLKNRGLSGEIARQFSLGFAPNRWHALTENLGDALKTPLHETGMLIRREDGQYHDRFRDRIMFPIHDRRGRIIGSGGRIINQGEPKYLNSPETPLFHKGRELYGLHQVLKAHRDLPRLVIVEGYMDVIALFQHGITYAVATLGTATTAHHLETLFRYTAEIIFCFDGDAAGRTAAARALQIALPHMQDGRQIRFLFLEDGEDPDSLIRKIGKEALAKQLETATPLSQFFFQTIAAQSDLSSLDGRARFMRLAMEQLELVPEGIFQKMMLDELAKKARMEVTTLQKHPPTSGAPPRKSAPTTPLRLAITLLIQQPSLATLVEQPLPPLNQPGAELLGEILTALKECAITTTGELLEHWRDRPESGLLAKLASQEHMIPPNGIESEFKGAINRLHRQSHEQAIAKLLAKASESGLTAAEKATLHELIHSK